MPLPRSGVTLGLEFIKADVENGTIALPFEATEDLTKSDGQGARTVPGGHVQARPNHRQGRVAHPALPRQRLLESAPGRRGIEGARVDAIDERPETVGQAIIPLPVPARRGPSMQRPRGPARRAGCSGRSHGQEFAIVREAFLRTGPARLCYVRWHAGCCRFRPSSRVFHALRSLVQPVVDTSVRVSTRRGPV